MHFNTGSKVLWYFVIKYLISSILYFGILNTFSPRSILRYFCRILSFKTLCQHAMAQLSPFLVQQHHFVNTIFYSLFVDDTVATPERNSIHPECLQYVEEKHTVGALHKFPAVRNVYQL